jgi:cyanate permease
MISALPMYAAFTVLRSSLSLLPLLAYCAMAAWAWAHRYDDELQALAATPSRSVLRKEPALS